MDFTYNNQSSVNWLLEQEFCANCFEKYSDKKAFSCLVVPVSEQNIGHFEMFQKRYDI